METSPQEILTKKGQRNSQEEGKGSLMKMLWSRSTGQAVQTRDGERQRAPRRTCAGGKKMN